MSATDGDPAAPVPRSGRTRGWDRFLARLEHLFDTRSERLSVWLVRKTRGAAASRLYHRRVLVLTTRGRKTGLERTVVVQWFPDGDDVVVVAANSGMPSPPGWYFNLMAEDHARVEISGEEHEVTAQELSPEEAAEFWPRVLEAAPDYARYPSRTDRPIALVRLHPVGKRRDAGAPTAGRSVADLDATLTQTRAGGIFVDDDLGQLPDAVQRYFRASIAARTPLALAARLRMRGQIKLGVWLPFRSTEVLAPHAGFVWAARVGGVLVGSDQFADGTGGMEWKLAGLVPVVRAWSDDVARSSAERAGAEAVWVPTSLVPRFGVEWTAVDDRHIRASFSVGGHPVALDLVVGADGQVQSVALDRWGDPDDSGTWGLHRFGMEVSRSATFAGVTIPSEGRAGWYFGTDRWDDRASFRYQIRELQLVP